MGLTCTAVSHAVGESLAATAPGEGYGSWLLVEHPGPWTAFLPWQVLGERAAKVAGAAGDRKIQVCLIRRVRERREGGPYRVYLASNRGPAGPWVERAELADLDDLVHVDLEALAAGIPSGFGGLVDEPLLLVCTHGRRDRCCAQYGRPVAVALAAEYGDLVWEATHVGGDRFAANLVSLPDGVFHGRLNAENAVEVAAACLAGEVRLPYYRGRAGVPAAGQAAEHRLRVRTGETRAGAVRVAVEAGGTVRLTHAGREYAATVTPVSGEARRTSCARETCRPLVAHDVALATATAASTG